MPFSKEETASLLNLLNPELGSEELVLAPAYRLSIIIVPQALLISIRAPMIG